MRGLAFLAIAALVVVAPGCVAVGNGGGSGGGGRWGLPRGNYRESCGAIRVDGNYLKASCRTQEGWWRNTSLDLRACDRNIVNVDGHLRCGGGGGGGGSGYLPKGNYRKTCANIRVRDGMLRADCRTANGDWRKAATRADACARFSNVDGRLVCQ